MDFENIKAIAIPLAGFSLIAFVLLRFTSFPGLHVWSFLTIVLLSFPVAFGYVALSLFFRLPTVGAPGGPFARVCYITSVFVVSPTAVWAAFRYFRAVRRRPRQIWWLAAPCSALVLTYGCFWVARIPEKTLDQTWYTSHHEITQIPETNVPWTVTARAHIDNFVAPVTYRRRMSYFDAWRDDSDLIYIRFWADMHAAVVYCWSPRDGKLLWKAWEDHSS